jgi:hypothetical protein
MRASLDRVIDSKLHRLEGPAHWVSLGPFAISRRTDVLMPVLNRELLKPTIENAIQHPSAVKYPHIKSICVPELVFSRGSRFVWYVVATNKESLGILTISRNDFRDV